MLGRVRATRQRAVCALLEVILRGTCVMGAPAGLLVLMLASSFDFSHCQRTRFQSGAPPCAARSLLSWLNITLVISCMQLRSIKGSKVKPAQNISG